MWSNFSNELDETSINISGSIWLGLISGRWRGRGHRGLHSNRSAVGMPRTWDHAWFFLYSFGLAWLPPFPSARLLGSKRKAGNNIPCVKKYSVCFTLCITVSLVSLLHLAHQRLRQSSKMSKNTQMVRCTISFQTLAGFSAHKLQACFMKPFCPGSWKWHL